MFKIHVYGCYFCKKGDFLIVTIPCMSIVIAEEWPSKERKSESTNKPMYTVEKLIKKVYTGLQVCYLQTPVHLLFQVKEVNDMTFPAHLVSSHRRWNMQKFVITLLRRCNVVMTALKAWKNEVITIIISECGDEICFLASHYHYHIDVDETENCH